MIFQWSSSSFSVADNPGNRPREEMTLDSELDLLFKQSVRRECLVYLVYLIFYWFLLECGYFEGSKTRGRCEPT